ncbi:MAG: hypothetical protein IPN71_01040 [Fibrobacteres bacterium]|nr:hypothetical protein [Fibrobacterota bacterium]
MSRHILPALFAATTTFALPHTFKANDPAKASEVNDNFRALDSAVGTKANQAVVSALATAIATKSDASLKDSLGARVDTASFHALKKKLRADSTKVDGELAARPARTWVESELASRPNRTWVDSLTTAKASLAWKDSSRTKVDTATFNALSRKQSADNESLVKLLPTKPASPANNTIAKFDDKGALTNSSLTDNGSTISTSATMVAPTFLGMIGFRDTRDSNTTPVNITAGTRFDFKACANIGVTTGGYCGLMTYRPWGLGGDFSGGPVHQLSFSHSGRIWHRVSTGESSWGAWNRLLYAGEAVASTGGTIDGNLQVTGNLNTKPNIPVADYVFEPGYKLAPLAEVEAYTKEHKHLPEIPSAKAIEADGLDLAQMNLLLLKKVEELTLHAIQQQKALEAQAKTNEELRLGLEELQVKIGR